MRLQGPPLRRGAVFGMLTKGNATTNPIKFSRLIKDRYTPRIVTGVHFAPENGKLTLSGTVNLEEVDVASLLASAKELRIEQGGQVVGAIDTSSTVRVCVDAKVENVISTQYVTIAGTAEDVRAATVYISNDVRDGKQEARAKNVYAKKDVHVYSNGTAQDIEAQGKVTVAGTARNIKAGSVMITEGRGSVGDIIAKGEVFVAGRAKDVFTEGFVTIEGRDTVVRDIVAGNKVSITGTAKTVVLNGENAQLVLKPEANVESVSFTQPGGRIIVHDPHMVIDREFVKGESVTVTRAIDEIRAPYSLNRLPGTT